MEKAGKILALIILGVFMVSFMSSIVAAQIFTVNADDVFFVSWFKTVVNNFLVPEGYDQPIAILSAIIGTILIFMIIGDLLSLVSPLSKWVNWSIAVGVMILLIAIGWVRTAVAFVMATVTVIFGVGGTLALVMTAVIFLLGVIFIFFGGAKLNQWLAHIKTSRENIGKIKKAEEAGGDAAAIVKAGKEFRKVGLE